MTTTRYVHWQDGDHWLGYLADYPDYWTQGETLDDLRAQLVDLYKDLTGGDNHHFVAASLRAERC